MQRSMFFSFDGQHNRRKRAKDQVNLLVRDKIRIHCGDIIRKALCVCFQGRNLHQSFTRVKILRFSGYWSKACGRRQPSFPFISSRHTIARIQTLPKRRYSPMILPFIPNFDNILFAYLLFCPSSFPSSTTVPFWMIDLEILYLLTAYKIEWTQYNFLQKCKSCL